MLLGIDASRAEKGQFTGVEWYSINIIKALIPLVPASWSVVLYSRGGDLSTLGELPKNWRIQVINAPLNRAWTILALSFYLLRHKPDVFFEPSHIMPYGAPKKSLTMVHDTAWLAHPEAYSWQGKIILNQSLRHARRAAKVLVPTDFVKQELLNIGFKTKQVTRVWHGLDHAAYRIYSKEEIAPTLAAHAITKPYFLCVGRVEEKKNTSRLLDAWERGGFAKEYDLVIIGKAGFGGESIIRQAKKVSGVRMLGWCKEEELPHLYAGAFALVYPTLYEGFGFPALQAAACGTPVVAAEIGALKEIIENAIWVHPLQVESIALGMKQIIADSELRKNMITKGRIEAQAFTWEEAGKETWAALQSLL